VSLLPPACAAWERWMEQNVWAFEPVGRSEYSKQLNEMRLKVLAAKEAAVQEIITEAKARLRDVSKNPATYKQLLQDLLVQAMRKLGEKVASVRCRQVRVRRGRLQQRAQP
jgi:V-type H+-transporting ATPase subunit E